jgi:cytochrome c553
MQEHDAPPTRQPYIRAAPAARRTRVVRRAVFFCCIMALACAARGQARDPERGAARAGTCEACHGTPERPPIAGSPTLAGQQREFLVLQMFYLREGLRDVPQMAGLFKGWSDRDLEDVAAHYGRQKAPRNAAERDAGLHARGAELSLKMGCGSCHLKDYSGQKHVPRISGQREDYLAATLVAYRDNKRTGTDTSMNAAMYQVPDSDIRALAHYLAQQ